MIYCVYILVDNRLVEDVEVLLGSDDYEKSIKSTNHCRFPTARFALHVSAKCLQIINNNDNIPPVIVMRYECQIDARQRKEIRRQSPWCINVNYVATEVLMILPKLKITVDKPLNQISQCKLSTPQAPAVKLAPLFPTNRFLRPRI